MGSGVYRRGLVWTHRKRCSVRGCRSPGSTPNCSRPTRSSAGLIGPREAPRIWERHLLNCAAVAELIPEGATVVDVGSGAGLPGMVLAVARPDLTVTLVEPLARRTAFLTEAVASLGLEQTTVVRARAEECVGKLPAADVVTARAVAPLDRLAGWCLPLAHRRRRGASRRTPRPGRGPRWSARDRGTPPPRSGRRYESCERLDQSHGEVGSSHREHHTRQAGTGSDVEPPLRPPG